MMEGRKYWKIKKEWVWGRVRYGGEEGAETGFTKTKYVWKHFMESH